MKNVRYILSAALALAGFASCGDENMVSETAESQQGKQQMMTFTVNAPNVGDTRSQLDENGKSVVFNAEDAINVFINYDTQFKFTTAEGGSVATFTGTADAADQYYFLSPYQSTANGDMGKVYADLPGIQQAVPGSYDPNAMICIGEGSNTDQITLHQACALIKIKIAETLDGVQGIYLNGVEPLAGRLYIITNSGAIDYISDTEYQIALNGPFVAGSTYYICVPPQNLGKLTVSYTTATAVYERTAVNPLTAVAGHIYDFGEIDDTNYSISTQARILKKPSFGKYSYAKEIHIECEYAGDLPTAEVSDVCRIVGGIGCNTIWEVYDRNSNTLYIRTKASSILMPSSSGDFFRNYEYVTTITGLDKLDTRNVVSMYDMFYGCKWLTDVSGITNWDVSNVQRLNAMFRDCQRLETLDLSGWNTSNLTTMTDMYMNCYKLSTLKLGENFTLDNIQQMRGMFYNASKDTANGLTIYGVTDDAVKAKLKDDTDWNDTKMRFSGPIAGSATVSISDLTNANARTSCDWVQLWAGGPKWATFNVGASANTYEGMTEYSFANTGGYYSFCGKRNLYADVNGASSGDTAKDLWGANWRTPTSAEEQALLNNCDFVYCDGSSIQYETGCTLNGWKVTGRGDYAGNSIFMPLAGVSDQNQGNGTPYYYNNGQRPGNGGWYWAIDGSNRIYLSTTSQSFDRHDSPHGCSVRAVFIGE